MRVLTRRMGNQANVLQKMERILADSGLTRDVAIVATSSDELTRCARCAISPAVPGIQLDNDGLCTECRRYDLYKEKMDLYFTDIDQLRNRLDANKPHKRSDVDCLLLFSGGKDSTYVLHQLVDMGLKVRTYTFDNGFISESAFENIRKTTSALGIEHHTGSHADMEIVFSESLKKHSSVCKGCFKALLDLSLVFSDKIGINFIFTGLSRGQIVEERLKYFYDREIFDPDEIDKKLAEGRRVYHQVEKYTGLTGQGFGDSEIFDRVSLIDFFRYSDVEKKDIYDYLRNSSLGWNEPTDTGFCSSNCMINDVGISVHQTERGYSNYEVPTSWEVRLGHLERDAAINELTGGYDIQHVNKLMSAISYTLQRPETGAVPVDVYYVLNDGADLNQVKQEVTAIDRGDDFIVNFIEADQIERDENGGITPLFVAADADQSKTVSKQRGDELSSARVQRQLMERDINDANNWDLRTVSVEEQYERALFRQALLQVLKRQHALRLIPAGDDADGPVFGAIPANLPLSWADLSSYAPEARAGKVEKLAAALKKKAIANSSKSLISFAVATPAASGGSTLLVTAAHAVMDDISWHLLFSELERSYQACKQGQVLELDDLAKPAELDQPILPDWAYKSVGTAGRKVRQTLLRGESEQSAHSFAKQLASKLSLPSEILESWQQPGASCIGHFTGLPKGAKSTNESPDVVIVMREHAPADSLLSSNAGGYPDLAIAGGRSWADIRQNDGELSIRWTQDLENANDAQLDSAVKQVVDEWHG